MGKILVVEPRRMLQQAMALSLVPDHELRFTPRIPPVEDPSITEYDVIMIDAAGLREEDNLGAQEIDALQNLGIPIVWIEDSDMEFALKPGHFVKIQRPIEKKAILAAVAECVNATKTSQDGKAFSRRKDENASSRQPGKEESVAAGAQVIDLTDVVEEEPIQKTEPQIARKKK